MFACPGCGAGLRYDIAGKQLHCDYCDGSYSVTDYPYEKSAAGKTMYDVTVFTCPACGGELESTDNEIVQFCPFCGASNVLSSRVEGRLRPQHIIPFQKTKEDCVQAFQKKAKRALFAPKELRDPSFLEGFRGIYLPYWQYEAEQGTEGDGITFEGTKIRKDYYDVYEITVPLAATLTGLQCDASSSFDDVISEEIAPFGGAKSQESFEPGYLAGFYADTADVPSEVYEEQIRDYAGERTQKELTTIYTKKGYHVEKMPSHKKAFHTSIRSAERLLVPVWFLTFRGKSRVAYSVVNGETGKISADIPVDVKRYFLCSLALAVPLFMMLNLLLSVTAPSAMLGCGYLAALCGAIYCWNMSCIIDRDLHAEDLGYQYRHGTKREYSSTWKYGQKILESIRGSAGKIGWGVVIAFAIVGVAVADEIDFSLDDIWGAFGCYGMLGSEEATCLGVFAVILTLFALWRGVDAEDWRMIPEALLSVLAICVVLFVRHVKPVQDYYYYGGMLVCLILIAASLAALIFRHNELSTHPIPNFHDRKGGGSDEERQ